jgi:5-methylcytosine-specific restriction enzyme subunit McrC
MRIPVQNIFYLLCYAWDRWEEGGTVDVGTDQSLTMMNLFGKVLRDGTVHLLKRGMDRDYQLRRDDVTVVRGKPLHPETASRALATRAKTACEFDELTHDVVHNRILKATVRKMIQIPDLDASIRDGLVAVQRRMPGISEVSLSKDVFRTVRIHRNNGYYDFLLKVCWFVNENLFVEEGAGVTPVRDLDRDERKLARLFERFVLQFYRRELDRFTAGSRDLRWNCTRASAVDQVFLPRMRTDVVLESGDRKIGKRSEGCQQEGRR